MAKILVADDDPGQCEVCKLILETNGHEVTTTSSGEEAFEKFKTASQSGREVFSLVVTDMTMLGAMTGVDLAKSIHSFERAKGGDICSQTPVILRTGKLEGNFEGVTAILPKIIDNRYLTRLVEAFLK